MTRLAHRISKIEASYGSNTTESKSLRQLTDRQLLTLALEGDENSPLQSWRNVPVESIPVSVLRATVEHCVRMS